MEAATIAFDPTDRAFLDDPYPLYARGRSAARPVPAGPRGTLSVFSYELCSAVLRDHETWSSERSQPPVNGQQPPRNMLGADPPEHTRLRGLVSQAFTPRMVERLVPRMEAIAADLLDAVRGRDQFDVVDALAYPLPVIVIAELLGIPPADRDNFKRWSDAIVATLGGGLDPDTPRELPVEVIAELVAYLAAIVEQRRVHPREDLLSALVAAEVDGSRLSFPELIAMLILLLVAGNETTTNLIGNAIEALALHPAELQRLRADMSLLPAAVEEVLRWSSPVQMTARVARHDTTLAGVEIPAGAPLLVWLGSANRDEVAFPSPARFDITRSPNRHLAFGQGIHFCLGAPLARLEARVALEAFLARFASYALLPGPHPRVPTFVMRGYRELPIVVSPGA
jgi:cytochrome P450